MDEPSSPEGIPITLRIQFKSASLDDFVARYGADVSAGGIFIRTKQPLAVGSLLHFDFSLADASPLMAGLGTVVWVREPEPSRAGSIPGMGVRFDQLAPESQQTHQQILAVKARRGDRPTATPPQSPAAAAPPRPAARPATPPPLAARPTPPAKPVAAQPSGRGPSDTLDEFASGGKTEIADRPPSFYFDSPDKAHGAAAGERPAEDAAPKATLDDTNTESQLASPADPSWSEPIDISDDASATAPSAAAVAARAAATEQGRPQSSGDELAPASLDLPLGGSAPVADLPPPSGPAASAAPAAGQSWLDRAMKMTDGAGAAPAETSAEHTEETAVPPEATMGEAPALGGADRPLLGDDGAFEQDVPDLLAKKSGGQGKKLIVVGIVAAGLAFAGVYLMQTKPWQTPVAPAPAEPAPSPVAAPAAPKLGEPSQPAAAPTPPPVEAVPVKPAEKLPTPEPTAAPSKSKPEVVEAAKPVEVAKPVQAAKPVEADEFAKHPGPAAGSAKKTASRPASSPPPSAPGSAGPSETVYLVKVRSLPAGAQVLIDAEPMGQTPFQRRILDMDKPHTVTVRKPGYLSYESSVSPSSSWVKDGNTQTLGVFAKLKKMKAQAAESPAAPAAQPTPSTDSPEKL